MMIKYAIVLAMVLIVAAFAAWAFLPPRHLPGHRARHLRIRLHLRLHPGKGFATVVSLWLRWGRLAALRRFARIRPALPLRYRILDWPSSTTGPGKAAIVTCSCPGPADQPRALPPHACKTFLPRGPVARPYSATGCSPWRP